MVSDLYVFDLDTFQWELIPASPQDDVPRARYFHSTDTCMEYIISSSFHHRSAGLTRHNREQSSRGIRWYEQPT